MDDDHRKPSAPSPSGGGGTYGQEDASESSRRSRLRTEKPNEIAAGRTARKGGTLEGGETLDGADARGAHDEDLGRGAD